MTFYTRIEREIRRAYDAGRAELVKSNPDAIIHLGDVTGGWRDCGMQHSSVTDAARACIRELKSGGAPVYVCVGNHDAGFRNASDADFRESLDRCADVFGPLSWRHDAAGILFVGLCSPLLDYPGKDPELLRRKQEQKDFLREALEAHRDRPFVLCLHRPFSVRHVLPELAPHMRRCRSILAGDLHRPRLGAAIRWFARLPAASLVIRDRAMIRALRKVSVCPSTAPLWWRGYGLLHVNVTNGKLRRTHVRLERPVESEDLPTASFRHCWKNM
jgi:hypothetical protein